MKYLRQILTLLVIPTFYDSIEIARDRMIAKFRARAARWNGLFAFVLTFVEALLTLLMLRGPQTTAELRMNTERLHRFADASSVEGFLDELTQANDKRPAYVTRLPRAPGARESRWAHLLCGEVIAQEPGPAASARDDELAFLRAEQQRLNAELEALKTLVLRMAQDLGIKA